MFLPPPPITLLVARLSFRAVSACSKVAIVVLPLTSAVPSWTRSLDSARLGPCLPELWVRPGQPSLVIKLGLSLDAQPFTSHVIPDASLAAPHLSLWTCLPILRSAVPVWRSSCLPSKSGPKASVSLACQVRAGSYRVSYHVSPNAGLTFQRPVRGRGSH